MHYCVWANWGAWSSCSETCGTGSTKTRSRHLTMQDTPGHPIPALNVASKAQLEELRRDQRALAKGRKAQHVQELAVAFGCGCMTIVVVLYVTRLVSRAVVFSDRRSAGYDQVLEQNEQNDVDVSIE